VAVKIAGIYKLTCQINGKSYIGQSVDILRRWRLHYNDSLIKTIYPIHQAIHKYGWENFDKSILIELLPLPEILDYWESFYIKKFHTFMDDPLCNGYNLTTGGASGRINSKETGNRISKSNRGRHLSEDHKYKLRASHLGKQSSESHCQHISQALKGIERSSEFGKKISKSKKNVPWTEATMEHQLEIRGKKSLFTAGVSIETGEVISLYAEFNLCGLDGGGVIRAIKKGTIYRGSHWRKLPLKRFKTGKSPESGL
jgi:group I intron endonuclease